MNGASDLVIAGVMLDLVDDPSDAISRVEVREVSVEVVLADEGVDPGRLSAKGDQALLHAFALCLAMEQGERALKTVVRQVVVLWLGFHPIRQGGSALMNGA
jgi:hypothetical protein